MTIKQYGGVFGRNPTFNDVEIEGDLSVDGTLTIGGNVITGLDYEGGWNASTNTPDLTTTPPAAGKFWIVSVAGSTNLGGITNWSQGDWALYDGSAWQRVEGGTVDLTNGVTGILPIANGGTNASTASTARTNLGSGAVGDNLFTAATALAAQQAMDTEVGTDVQAYDAGLQSISGLTTAADKMIYTTASDTYAVTDLTAAGRAILDDANAAAQRTTLGSGAVGDNVFTAATASAAQQAMDVEVGVDVQAYDATILKSADIGSTVQGYDADTAKYDDSTANFTGTLQNGGSNVVVDTDIGSTVQGYDADTTKNDVSNTFTQAQVFPAGAVGTPAITTTGDTNTGIFFPAADTIAFAEGGAEAMRIDSSSRLLVGYSSSPSGDSVSNSGAIRAVEFTTSNGEVSVPASTTVTLYTVPALRTALLYCWRPSGTADYNGVILHCKLQNGVFTPILTDGANVTLSVSGGDINISHSVGVAIIIAWRVVVF